MHRKLLKAAGMGLAVWTTGCCMCDAPYDYCGPTFLGGPCEYWTVDARVNSAFTPHPGLYHGEYVEGDVPPQSVLQSPEADAPTDSLEPPPMPPPQPSPSPTTQAPRARSISVSQ